MEGGEEGEGRGVTVTVVSCLFGYWCCCAAEPPSLPWWDLVGVWPTWWLCEEGMTSCRNVGRSWRGVSFARRLINCSVPSVINFISMLIINRWCWLLCAVCFRVGRSMACCGLLLNHTWLEEMHQMSRQPANRRWLCGSGCEGTHCK